LLFAVGKRERRGVPLEGGKAKEKGLAPEERRRNSFCGEKKRSLHHINL